jgi:predicted phage replisome organizer
MSEKRYYWLKFKEDFFGSLRIKKLRKMAGGDTYVIIYLKMQLKALRTDGVLSYTGLEPDFVDELALDLDETPDDIRITLAYLMSCGLCECSDNIHYFLPFVVENTGSETAGTQRWRDWKNTKSLESNKTPTQLQQTANEPPTPIQQNANVEKEKEKEKRDRDKSKGRKFTPPTLEQVKAYAKEANLSIDCEKFYTYFTTPNDAGQTWIDSKGNPVRNWKQKMITWANKGEQRTKSRNTLLNYNESPNVKDIDLNLDEL